MHRGKTEQSPRTYVAMPMNTSRQTKQPQSLLVFECLLLHNESKDSPETINRVRISSKICNLYQKYML